MESDQPVFLLDYIIDADEPHLSLRKLPVETVNPKLDLNDSQIPDFEGFTEKTDKNEVFKSLRTLVDSQTHELAVTGKAVDYFSNLN